MLLKEAFQIFDSRMPFIFDFWFGLVSKEAWPFKKEMGLKTKVPRLPLILQNEGEEKEVNLVTLVDFSSWSVWQPGLSPGRVASVRRRRHAVLPLSLLAFSSWVGRLSQMTSFLLSWHFGEHNLCRSLSVGSPWEKTAEGREQRHSGACVPSTAQFSKRWF